MQKHEWRKEEKNIYLPKAKPELIDLPAMNYVTIKGQGNPNAEKFTQHIQALYPVCYAIKMNLKKLSKPPKNYVDFTVYPLEGEWSLTEKGIKNYSGKVDKDELLYTLMIRQPEFVSKEFFEEMKTVAIQKNENPLIQNVQFEKMIEGKCVQMLHIGSFDEEPKSFAKMEQFANENSVKRLSKIHKEIYLSDFRRVPEAKRKTVLRFKVKF